MTQHSTDSGNLGSRPARPDWIVRAVWAVLAVHAGLLAWGASIHSPGWDEWGHLPAGISHWHLSQFDLYRVNPPLVRMVAAAPVLFCGPEIEWPGMSGPHWRPEWEAARSMVRTHSERLFWWFTLARWVCIAFSLLGGWICFRWALDLYGPPAGLTAAMLWCFSPLVDWGQDLLLLKRWVDRHPEARPLGVAYSLPSAIIDMAEVGIPAVPVPRGSLPDGTAPPSPEEPGRLPGWYAIFVRELRERQGWYAYFRHFEPVAMVGYTVYIYHIWLKDANRVRWELGLAELPSGIQPATAPRNEEHGGAGP
jgi:hypothetical protein